MYFRNLFEPRVTIAPEQKDTGRSGARRQAQGFGSNWRLSIQDGRSSCKMKPGVRF